MSPEELTPEVGYKACRDTDRVGTVVEVDKELQTFSIRWPDTEVIESKVEYGGKPFFLQFFRINFFGFDFLIVVIFDCNLCHYHCSYHKIVFECLFFLSFLKAYYLKHPKQMYPLTLF